MARGPIGSRLATGVTALPATVIARDEVDGERARHGVGQPQRREHRGEGVAGHAGDREETGDPLGVRAGELEHRVDAHRPAHQHGRGRCRSGPSPRGRPRRSARSRRGSGRRGARSRRRRGGSTRRPHAAVGAQQGRPHQGLVPRPLHSTTVGPSIRPVGVVGPGAQVGAVVGEDVAEGQRGRGGARGGGRHAPIVPDRRSGGRRCPARAVSRGGVARRRPRRRPRWSPVREASASRRGQEVGDVLALGATLGAGRGGDHGVATGLLLGGDRPVAGRRCTRAAAQRADDGWSTEHAPTLRRAAGRSSPHVTTA